MAKATNKKMASWATDYFEACLDRQQQLMDVLEISAVGITGLKGLPRLIEVLNKINASDDGDHQDRLASAERRANLAISEESSDFSTLHGFGVVALWSWLESFVIDLVVLWVARRPSSVQDIGNLKIKMSTADLLRLKGMDKARFIVEGLDREIAGSLRAGFSRFDQLLKVVGLAVRPEEKHKRDLYEFQKVRNCLAHRNGIADAKLKSECPWLKVKVGSPVIISRDMLARYSKASAHLLLNCLYSAGVQLGADLSSVEVPPYEKAS